MQDIVLATLIKAQEDTYHNKYHALLKFHPFRLLDCPLDLLPHPKAIQLELNTAIDRLAA
jgi:hypothetical protein